jgi:hypothetical protein
MIKKIIISIILWFEYFKQKLKKRKSIWDL